MQTELIHINGAKTQPHFDKIPDMCPVCLHAAHPIQIGSAVQCYIPGDAVNWRVRIAYRCPRQACFAIFVAQYTQGETNKPFKLSQLMPQTPKQADLPEAIAEVSPSFVKIYNQANAADSAGLDEIAGVGLRRALEFLIKDYCIRKDPSKELDIKKTFLGTCIKDFVTDANIKKCAERATWLGNDETHYVRVWNGHDIDDLKILIKLTVNWIANEVLTEKYFSSMPNK